MVVHMVVNAEVKYVNVRIPLYDDEGFPMAATEWVNYLRRHLRKTCGVRGKDRSTARLCNF